MQISQLIKYKWCFKLQITCKVWKTIENLWSQMFLKPRICFKFSYLVSRSMPYSVKFVLKTKNIQWNENIKKRLVIENFPVIFSKAYVLDIHRMSAKNTRWTKMLQPKYRNHRKAHTDTHILASFIKLTTEEQTLLESDVI